MYSLYIVYQSLGNQLRVSFFPLFSKYIYQLCNDRPAITLSTQSVLNDFAEDGIIYLELRTTPRAIPEAKLSKAEYVGLVLNTIASSPTKASMTTKLILSIDRRNTLEQALEVVELATQFQDRGVVAIDLCGDPSCGDVSTFRPAFQRAKAAGLKITIHFAEIPTQHNKNSQTSELLTLLDFYPDRLGHVIHVPDDVKNILHARRLGLELCVSCNVHAKMMLQIEGRDASYGDHHFGYWKETHCPIVLCTDDVGVFGSKLSNEYKLVSSHFRLGRSEILQLVSRGVECIFGGEEDRRWVEERLWLK